MKTRSEAAAEMIGGFDRERLGHARAFFDRAGIIGYDESRATLATPVDWIWQDVIAGHHMVEMSGASYTGKSTLAILLAVGRANPTSTPVELFGRAITPMPEGQCALIVNEENGRASACAKIDVAIEIFELPARQTWERIALLSRAGVVAGESIVDEIRKVNEAAVSKHAWASIVHAADRKAFGLMVFDTRALIFRRFGNAKDEDSQAEAAAELRKVIDLAGAPAILISHTRKGGDGGIEDVSGSAQRGGAADVILMVKADRESGKVLNSTLTFEKLRDGLDVPGPVTFSMGRDDVGKWRLTTGAASAQAAEQPGHDRIYALLERKGAMTRRQIRDELKMNDKRVKDLLDVLKTERRVQWRKKVVSGKETWMVDVRPRLADDPLRALGLVKAANAEPEPPADAEDEEPPF